MISSSSSSSSAESHLPSVDGPPKKSQTSAPLEPGRRSNDDDVAADVGGKGWDRNGSGSTGVGGSGGISVRDLLSS